MFRNKFVKLVGWQKEGGWLYKGLNRQLKAIKNYFLAAFFVYIFPLHFARYVLSNCASHVTDKIKWILNCLHAKNTVLFQEQFWSISQTQFPPKLGRGIAEWSQCLRSIPEIQRSIFAVFPFFHPSVT
jgi:hypothetical protein